MAKTKNKPRQLDAAVLSAIPLLNGEPVLMGEAHARALLARVTQPLPRNDSDSDTGGTPTLNTSGNTVAIIPIVGVLTKYATWYDGIVGLCPATVVEQLLALAIGDPNVSEIILSIDTPGGYVNGTVALADAVAAANKIKPVTGFVHGMCCSGGYYVASQCGKIYARREAWVGNIGVYSVLVDVSKFYEQMGIELTLVTSGANKGLGADGKVTDAFVAENQRLITGLYQQFVTSVCTGRGMTPEQVAPLADGRTFLGPEALANKLIDGVVETFDDALQAANNGAVAPESGNMKTKTPQAAKPATTASKAGDDKAPPTNDDVRSSLTDAKTSAETHTTKARAAMDTYKAMSDEPDDDTKEQCKQTASALKACAEESNRCALALEGSEDDADPDDDDDDQQKAFTANQYMSAFGNQGAVWYIEKKPFAVATTEFITQLKTAHKAEIDGLKAENETLKTKLKSVDLGNPAASFNVAEGKSGNPVSAAGAPTASQIYIANTKMPERKSAK